jgi:hypothetical protein
MLKETDSVWSWYLGGPLETYTTQEIETKLGRIIAHGKK